MGCKADNEISSDVKELAEFTMSCIGCMTAHFVKLFLHTALVILMKTKYTGCNQVSLLGFSKCTPGIKFDDGLQVPQVSTCSLTLHFSLQTMPSKYKEKDELLRIRISRVWIALNYCSKPSLNYCLLNTATFYDLICKNTRIFVFDLLYYPR